MQQPLEARTLLELRGIAQALGVRFDWSMDNKKLIVRIKEKLHHFGADVPTDTSPDKTPIQQKICDKLAKFKERGLTVSFPTKGSVLLTYTLKRQDACSTSAPLKTIEECARKVIEG